MALAAHNPGKVSKKNKGVLKMSGQQLHDYAATPRKGLPKHSKTTTVADMMERE